MNIAWSHDLDVVFGTHKAPEPPIVTRKPKGWPVTRAVPPLCMADWRDRAARWAQVWLICSPTDPYRAGRWSLALPTLASRYRFHSLRTRSVAASEPAGFSARTWRDEASVATAARADFASASAELSRSAMSSGMKNCSTLTANKR